MCVQMSERPWKIIAVNWLDFHKWKWQSKINVKCGQECAHLEEDQEIKKKKLGSPLVASAHPDMSYQELKT